MLLSRGVHEALPEDLAATIGEGGRLEEFVRLLSGCVSEVVVNRLHRSGLSISRVSPYTGALIHSLVWMILNGVDLRVLVVWLVRTDGLVIALVREVSILEWPIGRWKLLLGSFLHIVLMRIGSAYLREITVEPIGQLLIIEGTMLHNCCGIGAVGLQDLISAIYIVLLDQLLFVLVEIFCVRDLLLKGLIGKAGQEVLLQVGGGAGRRTVGLVLKLRVADKLVCTAILEHRRVLGTTSYLGSHPLHFFVVIWLPKEVLTGVDEFITDSIRLELPLKQVPGAAGRVVKHRLDLADLRPLSPFNVVIYFCLLGLM